MKLDSPPPPRFIYRLLPEQAWRAAQLVGAFYGSEHDLRDGFIHFSTREQLAETAARHYAGQRGLVLLGVPVAALGARLRWEVSRGGELFPHLYAPLALEHVTRSEPLLLTADERHALPADLEW